MKMENYSGKEEKQGKKELCTDCETVLFVRPDKVGGDIYPKIEESFCSSCGSYFSIKNGQVVKVREGIKLKKEKENNGVEKKNG